MSNYGDDRNKSDRLWKRFVKSGLCNEPIVSHRKAPEVEDNNNAIDYYINDDTPVQWRVQFIENKKSCPYFPTFRYERPNSKSSQQQRSEYFKIERNIKTLKPFPKYHIWTLYNKSMKRFEEIYILDISKFYDADHVLIAGSYYNSYGEKIVAFKTLEGKYVTSKISDLDKKKIYLIEKINTEKCCSNSSFVVINLNLGCAKDIIKYHHKSSF